MANGIIPPPVIDAANELRNQLSGRSADYRRSVQEAVKLSVDNALDAIQLVEKTGLGVHHLVANDIVVAFADAATLALTGKFTVSDEYKKVLALKQGKRKRRKAVKGVQPGDLVSLSNGEVIAPIIYGGQQYFSYKAASVAFSSQYMLKIGLGYQEALLGSVHSGGGNS